MRSLLNLRQILEVGIGATVIPAADRPAARDGRVRGRRQPQGQGAAENAARAWSRRSPSPPRRFAALMTQPRDRLIVALDVPNVGEARALIETLGDSVGVYKIGLELLFCGGFALAQELARESAARVRRCQAARYRGDGRARDRRDRPHGRRRFSPCTRSTGRRSTPRCAAGATARSSCSASRCSPISRRPISSSRACDHPLAELVLHRAMLAKEAASTG